MAYEKFSFQNKKSAMLEEVWGNNTFVWHKGGDAQELWGLLLLIYSAELHNCIPCIYVYIVHTYIKYLCILVCENIEGMVTL